MAKGGVTVIVISSSSSSSSSSSEDEEQVYERSQKLKLREQCRLFRCAGRESGRGRGGGGESDDDDCIILEKDPFAEDEAEVARTIADLPSKLSLTLSGREGRKDGSFGQRSQHLEAEGEEESEVCILSARGKVALKDYPHSRHLCAKYPFSKTPHEKYCEQCYCYACDKPAPCGQWKKMLQGHCHATDQDELWKRLRKANRSTPSSEKVGSQLLNT